MIQAPCFCCSAVYLLRCNIYPGEAASQSRSPAQGPCPDGTEGVNGLDTSSQMLVFVKVVENGSISAASRAGGQTPSAVSKQIGLLEEHVGHRLLHRTRTGVSLTAEGREYYEKCKALARSFEEAEAHIQSLAGPPKGTLRVTSSVAFGKSQLISGAAGVPR
jgi:molybdenum-dependent DNA-binding transcriptional regulator ModE